MGVYGHMQPYIQAFGCIYNLKKYICTLLHLSICLCVLFLYIYTQIHAYIGAFWLAFGLILHQLSLVTLGA